jgi:hypothetical protein
MPPSPVSFTDRQLAEVGAIARSVVLVGNSNSNILMVQAAQYGDREHASRCPDCTRDRRVLLQR